MRCAGQGVGVGGGGSPNTQRVIETCTCGMYTCCDVAQYLALDEFSSRGGKSRYCPITMFNPKKPLK